MKMIRLLAMTVAIVVSLSESAHAEFDKKVLKTLMKSYSNVEYIDHSDCYKIMSKDKHKGWGICQSNGSLFIEPIYQRIIFEKGHNEEPLVIALNPIGNVSDKRDNKIYSLKSGEIFNAGPNEPQIIDGGFLSGYMMPIFDYNGNVVLDCRQTAVAPFRRSGKIIGYRVNNREIVNKEPKDDLWICDENFNKLFTLEGPGYLWKVEEGKDDSGNFAWICTFNNNGVSDKKLFSQDGQPIGISNAKPDVNSKTESILAQNSSADMAVKKSDTLGKKQSTTETPAKATSAQSSVSSKQASSVTITPKRTVGKSDVDYNIPKTNKIEDNTFAVIISNQEYMEVPNVDFAVNDGDTFSQYCKSTLGIPESNIRFVKNATLNQMKRHIHWLSQIADAYGESAKFIVYYSGHGIPDEATNDAYLLPVDAFPADLSTGYKVNQLYSQLSEMKVNQVVLIMDACFSGTQRNDNMIVAARGVARKPKPNTPQGKMIVLSAAQGDETAHSFNDKGHGMFTYFLLKKLRDSSAEVSLGELSDYIVSEVKKASLVQNDKIQTPAVSVSPQMKDIWRRSNL